ncbi:MAG: hypothetical protein LQ342_007203 [Letrouitia transgressa]|nr:MAG: hypothetical protein LQ342_007203 [Letrouitia transgressa]
MATTTATVDTTTPVLKVTGQGIRSNEGTIDDKHLGQLRPTPKDIPLLEMQRRLKEDGYLFVKNLIPRDDVLRVRKEYFEHFSPTGILEPGTDPELGIFNSSQSPHDYGGIGAGELPPTDEQVRILTESHVLPQYLEFLQHPSLRQTVRDLTGWDQEILLKRTMLRHNVPGGLSTGVHYDKLFLRGGDAYFLTAWVPIGDIPLHGGGLIYLSRSSPLGTSIERSFHARAQSLPPADRISAFNAHMHAFGQLSQDAGEFHANEAGGKGLWLASDYEAGDVVFHDPFMIHASSRNLDQEGKRIRLSTDLRFYEEGAEGIDERWMKFWTPGDGL